MPSPFLYVSHSTQQSIRHAVGAQESGALKKKQNTHTTRRVQPKGTINGCALILRLGPPFLSRLRTLEMVLHRQKWRYRSLSGGFR